MSQIIQLGIFQKETTLPSAGRSFSSSGNELSSIEGRSADGTLHADFIKNNRTYQLSYSVVSEEDKDLLTGIYLSQIEKDSFLNFVYTDESDQRIATTVKMEEPVFGSIIPKDTYYYNGVTIDLIETAAPQFSILQQFITSDNLAFVTSDGFAFVANKAGPKTVTLNQFVTTDDFAFITSDGLGIVSRSET